MGKWAVYTIIVLYYLDYDWKWGLSQSEVLRLV